MALRHRAGYVNGEGDGCGLLLDIPKALWRYYLEEADCSPEAVDDEGFFVGHFFLDRSHADSLCQLVVDEVVASGCHVLLTRKDKIDSSMLGPAAARDNPVFFQLAGISGREGKKHLYRLGVQLEAVSGVHVVSLNHHSVVYKVVGDADVLARYYGDFSDARFASSFVLAHTRYSTNTATSFKRVQPFALLGHNGEINTIARFYEEAGMAGITVSPDFSDSQMVDCVIHHFVTEQDWGLFETAELLLPPIVNELKQMPADLSDMYMFFRALWGPFSQGPAGMMMRYGDEAVFSVDALGLRPLWLVDTQEAWIFTSEQGIVPTEQWLDSPHPLAPGEKMGVLLGDRRQLVPYHQLQRQVLERMSPRYRFQGERRTLHFRAPYQERSMVAHLYEDGRPLIQKMAAFGWRESDVKWLDYELQTGAEPIQSLGYDGPLPALDQGPRLLSDFLQETVAVVTNPAIDREREIEHFSTRVLLGRRPSFTGEFPKFATRIELQSPLVMGELPESFGIEPDELRALAHRNGTLTYEDLLTALHTNRYGTVEILIHREEGESAREALGRFSAEALEAVEAGAQVIVLDDRLQFRRGEYIDAFLVTAAVHKALLRPAGSGGGEHLRRRTSLLLRSGAIRNLHDLMTAIGLGANAVNPYLLWKVTADRGSVQGLENLYKALCKGIEKVLSTLGIHELRGYERLFGAVGLNAEIADILGVPNFCGTAAVGYSFADIEGEAAVRRQRYDTADERTLKQLRAFQLYPRIWKAASAVANGQMDFRDYQERLSQFEREHPVSLRHALELVETATAAGPAPLESPLDSVDTTIDGHSYPLVISSMSFGSQSEVAYRAYAEAACRTNIVAMNGEGGEIKDILTAYPNHRGRQIASGRFGANADLCNHAYVLEIKIGQGAKPGEGGHLPGSKVTEKVASARNAAPGVDLISPSNNHDIYSIEDLAQVVQELHTVNPLAKVAVKVPVVPNIGTIAVGIVKAGADIVNLSGFDGGTGAARAHALRHVGLPMEIGVKRVHEALCAAGLRDVAEIWTDGGMKSGVDVMKAILLGANRVGFGTLAMVAIGCTSCRGCHLDTCHVGIATQMESRAEAEAKGVKSFAPRQFDVAVDRLQTFFTAIGEEVRRLTKTLGASRTQDLVGRSDLLRQTGLQSAVHLEELLRVDNRFAGSGSRISYRNWVEIYGLGDYSATTEMAMAAGSENHSTAVPKLPLKALAQVSPAAGGAKHEDIHDAPRTLGTFEAGLQVRQGGQKSAGDGKLSGWYPFVAGNGFAAFHTGRMHSVSMGGAQDGVGKMSFGGRIVVLKQRLPDGRWIGGSVGKGVAYGAQDGLFLIQGDADARACIRLSGADVVFGGEVTEPLRDELASIGTKSNLKGFAFEYMTAGRAVVLGDPGPWMCAGMSGGSVYLRVDNRMGLTDKALRRRIAKGAKVMLQVLDDQGVSDVTELLEAYQQELRNGGQDAAAQRLQPLLENPQDCFLMVRPGEEITDQDIATE